MLVCCAQTSVTIQSNSKNERNMLGTLSICSYLQARKSVERILEAIKPLIGVEVDNRAVIP